MISTSSYKACNTTQFNTVSISFDKGKDAGYTGECYLDLAPNRSFFNIWRDNKGIKPEIENNEYYVDQYYFQVLSKLDPEEIYTKLKFTTLLCYENNDEFCHRHIVAAWLELLLDIEVPEVALENDNLKIVERPTYIKPMLERVMRKYIYMNGYTSLKAYYLFQRSEQYKRAAIRIEKENKKLANVYYEQASSLKVLADIEEEKYKKKNQGKTLKK